MSSRNFHHPYWPLLLVLTLSLIAPLAFPPLEQIRDSLFWATVIRDGNDLYSLYNPHHLAYLPVSRVIYVVLSQIFAGCDAIAAAQVHSVAWGLIAVTAIFIAVRKITESSWLALSVSLTLVVSKTFWIYTMQVSPYVPMIGALALLALAVVLLEVSPDSKARFALLICAYARLGDGLRAST